MHFVPIVTIISLKDYVVVHCVMILFGWIPKKSGKLTLKILIHFKIIKLLGEVKQQCFQILTFITEKL